MSLRSHLLLLILATLVPIVVFGAVSAFLIAERQQALFENGARERTLALSTALDAELLGHAKTLQALAGSTALDRGDLEAFHQEARRVLRQEADWRSVTLAEVSGELLLSAEQPFGVELPPIVERPSFSRAVESAAPVIGDLFHANSRHQFGVRVPVPGDRGARYVLTALVDPSSILGLLTPQRLPDDWVGVVIDSNRRIVARTMNPSGTLGQLASQSLRSALDQGSEGWFHGSTLEGAAVFTPYTRSDLSGWTVAFGIPESVVTAGARTTASLLGGGLLVAIATAVALAGLLSRQIAKPISSLAMNAKALGRGRPLAEVSSMTVREVREVHQALIDSAHAVREREEALRATDRAKDEFLAMLGHELRNPLGAMMSAVHVLRLKGPIDDGAEMATDVVERQVRHMTRMVDDLLDASRVATGKVVLARQPLDMAKVVENAVRAIQRPLGDRNIHLDLSSVHVVGDEARIEQIVANLVGNAAKFTAPGGNITVRVARRDNEMVLDVEDDGVGIPAELLPHVFDLFVQGERSLDRTAGGLGIGLTLVKRLSELHGGRVCVHSSGPGRGTRFTVALPAIEAPQTLAGVAMAESAAIRRVLLIEDNQDARQTLAAALAFSGHTVMEASDGASGLVLVAETHPEAVVIDIGLPGIDGYEVAKRLRARHDGPSLVLIALTGYGEGRARELAFQAGFDAHLTKPASPDNLMRIIEALLAKRNGERSNRGSLNT